MEGLHFFWQKILKSKKDKTFFRFIIVTIVSSNQKGGVDLKKKGFFFTLETLLTTFLVLLLFGAGIAAGTYAIQNYKTHELKSQCDVLDRALETWAKSHQGVDESSFEEKDGKLIYSRQRLYPVDLDELEKVQSMKYFVQNIDLRNFSYSTQDGGVRYKLEVSLPDGSIYKSPRSGS